MVAINSMKSSGWLLSLHIRVSMLLTCLLSVFSSGRRMDCIPKIQKWGVLSCAPQAGSSSLATPKHQN